MIYKLTNKSDSYLMTSTVELNTFYIFPCDFFYKKFLLNEAVDLYSKYKNVLVVKLSWLRWEYSFFVYINKIKTQKNESKRL